MGNAYGSELLNLPIPVFAQYWNGGAFVTNDDDTVAAEACTTVPLPAVTLQPGGTAVTAAMSQEYPPGSGAYAFVAGTPGLVLSAPGVSGQADVTLSVPVWLQYDWTGTGATNPTARATFGVYQGNDVFIYRGRRGR
jgi:MSHA biogenesis protein MshQ